MKVFLKIFPIADISDSSSELDIELTSGKFSEVLQLLEQRWGVDPLDCAIMVICNGQAMDIHKDFDLKDNDKVWIMPRLSGG